MRFSKSLSESVMRLVWLLNPRTYVERLRIKMISKGQSSYDTKLYAIFVYNIDGRIPGYMRSWIDALNRQKINIWIITNKTLAEKTRAELLNVCDLFVERHNIGRDFGAYKDGISLLKSRQIDAENLLLSNDSVFYCGKDLEGTITALLAGRELSGLCESFDNGYHVQSYLLGIGPDLLHNGVFWDYWKKYLPISTRNWAIKKGEIGFSRVMVKNGVSANSIFYPKIILDVINGETYDNLINMLYLMPIGLRKESKEEYLALPPDNVRKSFLLRKYFIEKLVENSLTHFGSFILYKLLNFPIIKQDICYRGLYGFGDVDLILHDLEVPYRQEIMNSLKAKGTTKTANWTERRLAKLGMR